MQISWHGQYTVKIATKETTIVLDPYATTEGLSPFRAKADVVSFSNPSDASMSNKSAISGDPLIIDTPGEYSFRGCTLHSIGWNNDGGTEQSLQRLIVEDIAVLHVGALNRDLNEHELQELEKVDIDVLLVPVGGGSGLTVSQAMKMVTTIEPRIIIPIHYALPGLKEKLTSLKAFADEMGISAPQEEKKLVLKKSKLPQDEMQTVILVP